MKRHPKVQKYIDRYWQSEGSQGYIMPEEFVDAPPRTLEFMLTQTSYVEIAPDHHPIFAEADEPLFIGLTFPLWDFFLIFFILSWQSLANCG